MAFQRLQKQPQICSLGWHPPELKGNDNQDPPGSSCVLSLQSLCWLPAVFEHRTLRLKGRRAGSSRPPLSWSNPQRARCFPIRPWVTTLAVGYHVVDAAKVIGNFHAFCIRGGVWQPRGVGLYAQRAHAGRQQYAQRGSVHRAVEYERPEHLRRQRRGQSGRAVFRRWCRGWRRVLWCVPGTKLSPGSWAGNWAEAPAPIPTKMCT